MWQIIELWVGFGEWQATTLLHITDTSSFAEREADFDMNSDSSDKLSFLPSVDIKYWFVSSFQFLLMAKTAGKISRRR